MANTDFEIRDNVLIKYIGTAADVIIPEGITYIAAFSFRDCKNLVSISIPEGVTYIGHCAFSGCTSLTSITIPNGVEVILPGTFADCKSLTSISIPDSVTEIAPSAFRGCAGLADQDGFVIIKGVLYSYWGKGKDITVPAHTASVAESAFAHCEIKRITIPKNVTIIPFCAFDGCGELEEVTLLGDVTDIQMWAFRRCGKLTKIVLPNSVDYIGDLAFSGCDALTVCAPAGSFAEAYAKENKIPFAAI